MTVVPSTPPTGSTGSRGPGGRGWRGRGRGRFKAGVTARREARVARRQDAAQDASHPASRLQKADWLLLSLGIIVTGTGLAAILTADGDVCTTRTTTDTVFGSHPNHPTSGKRTVVTDCQPVGPAGGYPQAALIVGAVLILPAISRRVAVGFEASVLGAKLSKTAPSVAEVTSAVDKDAAKDPRV